jgi:hypothetical protein
MSSVRSVTYVAGCSPAKPPSSRVAMPAPAGRAGVQKVPSTRPFPGFSPRSATLSSVSGPTDVEKPRPIAQVGLSPPTSGSSFEPSAVPAPGYEQPPQARSMGSLCRRRQSQRPEGVPTPG